MDPSQWGNASRLAADAAAASSSSIRERDSILSHYLVTSAKRDAARQRRQHSLDTARLQQSLDGLGAARPADAAQDQLALQSLMAARAIQEALLPPKKNTSAAQHQGDLKLKTPPRSAPLESMENAPHLGVETVPHLGDLKLSIPPRNILVSMGNVQLENIAIPHPHDVLCGRGASVNQHLGNENYRDLVQAMKVFYHSRPKRKERAALVEDIIRAVRWQMPPGRFLKFDENANTWSDIGTKKTREKTAQALRENAPNIRHYLEDMPLIKDHKIHPAGRVLPLHSRNARASMEQQSNTSFPTLSSVGPLEAAASMVAASPTNHSLLAHPPSSATTASALNGFQTQSRDKLGAAYLARAASLISNGHSNQSHNDPTAEQLAAEIMAAHAREQEAKVAQDAAAAAAHVAEARPASLPVEMEVPTKLLPLLGQQPGTISALDHHAWDAGLPAGSLEQGSNLPLALSLQLLEQEKLDREKLLLANAMAQHQSLTAPHLGEQQQQQQQPQQQSLTSQEVDQVSSSLRDDLVHRLVLAETLAQRTVQGTITEAMKAQEKRLGLYVDAGLLGIDLGDMAEKQARGQSEESIVEEYYENLKLKRDDDGRASGPAHKKVKVGEASASEHVRETDIQDTLGAVGGMIRLRAQVAKAGAGSETETETEDSDFY